MLSYSVASCNSTRREGRSRVKTIYPAEQELNVTIRRTRRVLRNHVSAQLNSHKGQSSLSMCFSHVACARECAQRTHIVIWHVEIIPGLWTLLETLRAVPCHVLDGDQGTVVQKDEVEDTVA